MPKSTPEQLLETARNLFAERGFYGVSIASIADKHGLTKQALLHHFGSKEKLYGEVLRQIAEELDELIASAEAAGGDPKSQLNRLFQLMITENEENTIRTRLLMRELLDNKHRAETAGAWYLKPFLKHLSDMARNVDGWSKATDGQVRALVFQLLGAVNYYGVSGPTLQGVFGAAGAKALRRAFPSQFDALLEAAFRAKPS